MNCNTYSFFIHFRPIGHGRNVFIFRQRMHKSYTENKFTKWNVLKLHFLYRFFFVLKGFN